MENIDNVDHQASPSVEDLKRIMASVFESHRAILEEAFDLVKIDYADAFDQSHTLESLFSSDQFDRFGADEFSDDSWKKRQLRELTRLCMELDDAPVDQKSEVAVELIDYLVNV